MKKLASVLISIMMLVLINGLAFGAINIVSSTGQKTYDFKDEAITTSSYLELTLAQIAGASSWGVTDYSQSSGSISDIIVSYIDVYGSVISTESITVGTYYDVKDIKGSTIKMQFHSGVAAPVTAQGTIKFNFGSSGKSASYDSVSGSDKVTLISDNGGVVAVDPATNSLATIDYAHHKIHAGSHYRQGYRRKGINIGDTVALVFTTPDTTKWAHFTLKAMTTGLATVQLFRTPTLSAEGTTLNPLNRNENITNPATVVVKHTPTITTSGNMLLEKWIGGVVGLANLGGETRGCCEIILKQNTQYLLVLTAGANGINCGVGGDWYEHTNKN